MSDSNLTPIKPFTTIEGVELYANDMECGMSQIGLARFCGVNESKIRAMLESLARSSTVSKMLKPFMGKELSIALPLVSGGYVKVIPSDVCAAICTYYATESKAANDIARYSLGKFAAMGIESWIRKTTGHEQPSSVALTAEQLTAQLLQVTQQALQSETKLRITTEKLVIVTEDLRSKEQYISKATINAPGLNLVLEGAQDEELTLLTPEESKETYTLLEWLEYCKYPIPDKMYRQFRLKVAGFFESLRHYTPKKEYRFSKSGNLTLAYVYTFEDFHFLDAVFMQVSASYRK
jgi:hypothetical protein